MSKPDDIAKYHELAKDAGNRLRAYILSVSSGAAGVFFLSLTKADGCVLCEFDKWLLSIALLSFVATVGLCLYELRIDAKRFFALTRELNKAESEQNWEQNERYKSMRYWLIHGSYVTLTVAILATSIYLVRAIFSIEPGDQVTHAGSADRRNPAIGFNLVPGSVSLKPDRGTYHIGRRTS